MEVQKPNVRILLLGRLNFMVYTRAAEWYKWFPIHHSTPNPHTLFNPHTPWFTPFNPHTPWVTPFNLHAPWVKPFDPSILDVSGHPKQYAGYKETLEYGEIELKFITFVPFRFSRYQNYIFILFYDSFTL